MDPNNYETPQAQKNWAPPHHIGLSSSSSIRSEDSFISQVPLPYHLPASQDARFSHHPSRPRPSLNKPYGPSGCGQQRKAINFAPIPEHPNQQTPTAQYHGRKSENMRSPASSYGQYKQRPGTSDHGDSSYNPYDRSDDGYDQSSTGSFNSQYSSGGPAYNQGPAQGYNNHGRQGFSQNQWQSEYQNQNQQMSSGYQQSSGQNDRGPLSTWNANRFNDAEASHHGDGAGAYGRIFKDEDFLVNKGLHRRRSAGASQQHSNPRFQNYNRARGKRHSIGEDRPGTTWTTYETHAAGSPGQVSFAASGANTPRGSYAQPLPAPTPRTARELGEATPTLLEHTVREPKYQQSAHGPPPPFSLDAIAESPAKAPRGRSTTQDPFTAASVQFHPTTRRALSSSNHSMIGPARFSFGPGPHLAALCPGGHRPAITVAFDAANMPFVETARLHPSTSMTGVVRIFNIPFSCTSQEILAFFGRNARTIPEHEEPVHIVMERVTSKTMDAFVEFVDIHEAIYAVEKFEMNKQNGRGGRLGERHVNLEVCGQEVLMQALFPKATNVKWVGINPKILTETDAWNTGFKGFVSREELVMLEKHVECPQRSPFSKDCPQRPFECLISTLTKYPWNRLDIVTISDRDALHQTALALCKSLVDFLQDGTNELHIDERLLRRVKRAVFNCHGFSESQKDDFAFIFGMQSIDAGLPPYAEQWYVFKTIGAKRGWAPDVVLYYIALIREATTSSALVSLAEQAAKGQQTKLSSPFGNMKIEYPADVPNMSLADVGAIEWHVIEALLRKILPSDN